MKSLSSRMTKKTKPESGKKRAPANRAPRRMFALSYIPIAHHVYYTGYSFRTRVAIDGKTHSWNTSDKKKAIEYRDFLLLTRE